MKNFYGYMRVSTKEQNEDRQRIKLQEAGIDAENLFLDKQSGKDFLHLYLLPEVLSSACPRSALLLKHAYNHKNFS